MDELPAELFRHWVHSNEEDEDDLLVYRPAGYPLPPARGRRGFELREDGTFVEHGIAATDKRATLEGRWEVEAPGRVRIRFADAARADVTFEVVSPEEDRLTLRRHPQGD